MTTSDRVLRVLSALALVALALAAAWLMSSTMTGALSLFLTVTPAAAFVFGFEALPITANAISVVTGMVALALSA